MASVGLFQPRRLWLAGFSQPSLFQMAFATGTILLFFIGIRGFRRGETREYCSWLAKKRWVRLYIAPPDRPRPLVSLKLHELFRLPTTSVVLLDGDLLGHILMRYQANLVIRVNRIID